MSEKRIRVFREPTHSKGYVSINNATLQDIRLSYRARGILAHILSKPTTFQHNAESLVTASEGKAAIRAALKELRGIGYATLVKYRDELGKCRHRWEFRETPSADFQHTAPSTPKPGFGEPDSGAPNLGESVRIRNDGLRNHGSRNDGGGEAPGPVSFPWASLEQLPEDIRELFFDFGDRDKEIFAEIRGRKLRFRNKDQYPLADWPHVMASEIETAREKHAPKGRQTINTTQAARAYARFERENGKNGEQPARSGAVANPEPEGWEKIVGASLPAFEPDGMYHGRAWANLPDGVKDIVRKEVAKHAAKQEPAAS